MGLRREREDAGLGARGHEGCGGVGGGDGAVKYCGV